jgi:hypothetical protein
MNPMQGFAAMALAVILIAMPDMTTCKIGAIVEGRTESASVGPRPPRHFPSQRMTGSSAIGRSP